MRARACEFVRELKEKRDWWSGFFTRGTTPVRPSFLFCFRNYFFAFKFAGNFLNENLKLEMSLCGNIKRFESESKDNIHFYGFGFVFILLGEI